MTSIVTIQSVDENVVKVDENGRGEKKFTISNISGGPLRIGLQCQFENAEQKDWAKARGDIERDIGDQGSDQVIVDITVPKGSAPGKYEFKLLVYSTINPNLAYTLSDPIVIEVPEPKPVEPKKTFPWWIPVTAVVVILLIAGIVTWALWPSKMPDIVGKPITEAITLLEDKGLKRENIDVVEEHTGSVPEGEVRSQEPKKETKLEDKEKLKVNLIAEAFTKELPDLTGKTAGEAEGLLPQGVILGAITQEVSNKPAGTILRMDPVKGSRVVKGTKVNVVVVKASVLIPNLAGQTMNEARQTLEKLGLRVRNEWVRASGEALRVLSTKPASPTSVPPGSTVALVGVKKMVKLPNLVNQTKNQAKSIYKNLDLRVFAKEEYSTKPAGRIIRQTPAAGEVEPRSIVNLVYGIQPRVVTRGTVTLGIARTNKNVDLDTSGGRVNAGSASDVNLRFRGQPIPPFFEPSNRAMIGRIGNSSVGWNGCSNSRTSRYRKQALQVTAIIGKYICIKTTSGNYAELRILSIPRPAQPILIVGYLASKLKFSFTTWAPLTPTRKAVRVRSLLPE